MISILYTYNNEKESNTMISNDVEMPRRQTMNSAGYDFYAPFDVEFRPDCWTKFDTGVHFTGEEKVRPTFDHWVMLLIPRSSLGMKYGFRFSNTIGVIDQDYRNSIMVEATVNEPFTLKKGERFAQGIIVPFGTFTDEITPTKERNGGMGSTGQ